MYYGEVIGNSRVSCLFDSRGRFYGWLWFRVSLLFRDLLT